VNQPFGRHDRSGRHADDVGHAVAEEPPWDPWTPDEVAERLGGVTTRWYVVAGWAIDLFLGRTTRIHEDIEIGVPAAGFTEVRAALATFDCDVVGSVDGHTGMRWPLNSPAFDEHFQTWFRDPATGTYHLDVFRDPHEGDTWHCRRDPSIQRSYRNVVMVTDAGIPYMAPEIVLLFKAKADRPKDRADLDAVRTELTTAQRSWLRHTLASLHPEHPWLALLDS
jgi:Aminoglycoside-2''-adenylyltransferase